MEGNQCYKFSTLRNYVESTNQKPVQIIIEVGVNIGNVTRMLLKFFPDAHIYGFEAVQEYYDQAKINTTKQKNIRLFHNAITAEHLYADDLAAQPRTEPVPLQVLKSTPEAGPGWAGGSRIVPPDYKLLTSNKPLVGFLKSEEEVLPQTLDEIVASVLAQEGAEEIDLIKLDCEGCECSGLGCAQRNTLERIRFIAGEYHQLARFYPVMQHKLFLTHKVNLVGNANLGCFFAERREGQNDGLLKYDKQDMLLARPWLMDTPIDWHQFDERFVADAERRCHGLS